MFSALLERIALALERAGIPYMIIGGQAVLRHGEARLTRDIDVTLGVDLDRLSDVLRFAAEAGLEPMVDPEPFARQTMVLPCRDAASGLRVDLTFSHTRYEREAIARAGPVRIGTAGVRFASVEDLIVHKVVAGRPRDLEDVRVILIKNPATDRELVAGILGELDRALGGDFVATFHRLVQEAREGD